MSVFDYKVLLGDTVKELQGEVGLYLEKGWKLQGGVSITLSESDVYSYQAFAQAMVKEAE